jgi:hypothetical protein
VAAGSAGGARAGPTRRADRCLTRPAQAAAADTPNPSRRSVGAFGPMAVGVAGRHGGSRERARRPSARATWTGHALV